MSLKRHIHALDQLVGNPDLKLTKEQKDKLLRRASGESSSKSGGKRAKKGHRSLYTW